MKKINTAAARKMGKIEGQRLSIGLDSGKSDGVGNGVAFASRLLSELGLEVIVAHPRNVRLIGESRRQR
jgi:hypothetical protein